MLGPIIPWLGWHMGAVRKYCNIYRWVNWFSSFPSITAPCVFIGDERNGANQNLLPSVREERKLGFDYIPELWLCCVTCTVEVLVITVPWMIDLQQIDSRKFHKNLLYWMLNRYLVQ